MSERSDGTVATGRAVIEELARRFPQLYVTPAEGAQEAHRQASARGIVPEGATLDHFATSERDELRVVGTPAGPIEVLCLTNRADFETFLQIVGHKSQPVPIARTVGAITYLGLADWGKVRAAHAAYVSRGGSDWAKEFRRLAQEPGAFRSELIVISEGPYSNVAADETPYGETEWMRVSRDIRLHHECAHVVCRRLLPKDVLPVWDEVTADVCGLLCATGGYVARLAARFLGVSANGFEGGRLTEYLDETQREHVDAVATEVHGALVAIEREVCDADGLEPFDYLLEVKRHPLIDF